MEADEVEWVTVLSFENAPGAVQADAALRH